LSVAEDIECRSHYDYRFNSAVISALRFAA
jgi:hypothetical protein